MRSEHSSRNVLLQSVNCVPKTSADSKVCILPFTSVDARQDAPWKHTASLSETPPPITTLPVTGGGDRSILEPQQHLTSRARR